MKQYVKPLVTMVNLKADMEMLSLARCSGNWRNSFCD